MRPFAFLTVFVAAVPMLILFVVLLGPAAADEYYDLGCYVGTMTREQYYAAKNAVHVEPGPAVNDFKVGDFVTVSDLPGETLKVIGEKTWRHFLKSGVNAYGYQAISLKDGNQWWLSPSRMTLCNGDPKADSRHRKAVKNYDTTIAKWEADYDRERAREVREKR